MRALRDIDWFIHSCIHFVQLNVWAPQKWSWNINQLAGLLWYWHRFWWVPLWWMTLPCYLLCKDTAIGTRNAFPEGWHHRNSTGTPLHGSMTALFPVLGGGDWWAGKEDFNIQSSHATSRWALIVFVRGSVQMRSLAVASVQLELQIIYTNTYPNCPPRRKWQRERNIRGCFWIRVDQVILVCYCGCLILLEEWPIS
jgi:hypothetical protein